jgi:hypothetical protein
VARVAGGAEAAEPVKLVLDHIEDHGTSSPVAGGRGAWFQLGGRPGAVAMAVGFVLRRER